jgi:M6 family metalloprotease-like protein
MWSFDAHLQYLRNMKIRLPLIVAFTFAALTLNGAAHDLSHHTTSFVQPDGTKLNLKVVGTMYYSRTETLDGYTVIYNKPENKYYYAQPCPKGETIVRSQRVVGADSPAGLSKHLCVDIDTRNAAITKRKEKFDKDRAERWAKRVDSARLRKKAKKEGAGANFSSIIDPVTGQVIEESADVAAAGDANFADVVGSRIGLTIVVQFPDQASPVSQAKVERYCNEIGYGDNGNAGSIRDYFRYQSVGKLDYTMKVSNIVTLANSRDYYNYADYPANSNIRDAGEAGNLLIRDAVQILKEENFNFDGLTLGSNSKIVSTNVLFAGPNSGVWAQGLWPHQWQLQPAYAINVTVDGQSRAISTYQVTNVETEALTIGTFAHESGHLLLDYPDLYDYDGDSGGIGTHGLMASGSATDGGKTPSPINLHFKDLVGWANITEVNVNDFITGTLPSVGNIGYQITHPTNPDEFFVFENRGDGDIWAKGVPDKGVMIWHVDSGVYGNDDQQMTAASHYQVSLEQADGLFDLERSTARGDSGDAFDSNNEPFNDFSLPDSKWWNGLGSGIMVEVLSLPGSNMDIVFGGFGVIYPNGGEIITNLGPAVLRWAAGGASNVSIKLYKGGGYHSTIAASTENDGSYTWELDGSIADGTDYSILVTSLDDPTLFDASDTAFTIAPEATGGGGEIPNGWKVPKSADKGWTVSDEFVTEGIYSFMSKNIGDSKKSAIEYTGLMSAGTISFDCKVSCEPQFDFFNLYIDGVKQTIDPNDGAVLGYDYLGYLHKGRSGDRDWANFSFPVSAGVHTIKLEFKKDHTSSLDYYYRDAVWVDNIQMPLVNTAAAPSFATWAEERFGLNHNIMEVAGSEVDTDNDGIKNYAEYVFGLDPLKADQVKVETQLEGNQLSLIYPQNTAATDANYQVMESVSLTGGWTEAVVVKETLSSNGDVDIIKATVTVPDGHKQHFLKLNVVNVE